MREQSRENNPSDVLSPLSDRGHHFVRLLVVVDLEVNENALSNACREIVELIIVVVQNRIIRKRFKLGKIIAPPENREIHPEPVELSQYVLEPLAPFRELRDSIVRDREHFCIHRIEVHDANRNPIETERDRRLVSSMTGDDLEPSVLERSSDNRRREPEPLD